MALCFKPCKCIHFMLNTVYKHGYATTTVGSTVAPLGKAKKKVGKQLGAAVEKVVLPVETDAKKLVNFACGIDIKEGGTDVQLKPDNEYPDWLWNLNTGAQKPLSELDPNSLEYWKRVRRMGMRQNNVLKSIKPF